MKRDLLRAVLSTTIALGVLATAVACSDDSPPHPSDQIPYEGGAESSSEEDATAPADAIAPDGQKPDGGANFKRFFVTRKTFTGVKFGISAAPDGVTAADQRCQGAADVTGLGGKWVAWLSSPGVNAIDRIPDVGPWKNVKGTVVAFASKAAIASGPGYSLPSSDETGTAIPDHGSNGSELSFPVWTGTGKDLAVAKDTCDGWTDGNAFGMAGNPFYDWTAHYPGKPCLIEAHLYCFEK